MPSRSLFFISILFVLCACSSHQDKGEAYFESEEYEKAEYHFTEALKTDANNWKIIYNLARCKEELRKYEEAITLYSRSMDWQVTNAAYLGRARCFEKRDYVKGAIMDYSSALELNERNNFEAYYGRGRCYVKTLKYYKALDDLNHAINLQPDYINAYYHRSIARSQMRNHHGALKDMDHFISHKKNFTKAHFNRGIILQRMGQYSRAKSAFDKAIDLNLRSSEVYIRRGLCHYELGYKSKACNDFLKAKKYDQSHARNLLNRYCN